MEFQGEDHLDKIVMMIGINDVSRVPVTPEAKWEPLLVCLLNELKEKYRPPTRGAVDNTTEPDGWHAGGGLHERQRDPMERYDPQSGEKQP